MSRKSVDLTTLSGWASLSDGSHTITIKAKADGYLDSDASEGVTITKGSTSQIWKLNNIVDTESSKVFSISFTNSGVSYIGLTIDEYSNRVYFTTGPQSEIMVYQLQEWVDEKYQIIEVDTTSTDYSSFVDWAKNNGGVLLEAGDYKWVDNPKNMTNLCYGTMLGASDTSYQLNFISNGKYYSFLQYYLISTNSIITRAGDIGQTPVGYEDSDGNFVFYDEDWKIITIKDEQYVNFDFYNYAIIGENLIKQQSTTPVYLLTFDVSIVGVEVNGDTLLSSPYVLSNGDTIYAIGFKNTPKNGIYVNNIELISEQQDEYAISNSDILIEYKALTNGGIPTNHVTINYTESNITSETWVLNETFTYPSSSVDSTINFTSNNEQFVRFFLQPSGIIKPLTYYRADGTSVTVGSGGHIPSDHSAYRTITFETAPTGDLLTWLQANGVKQGGGNLITVTGTNNTYTTSILTKNYALPNEGDRVPQWDQYLCNDTSAIPEPFFGFNVYDSDNYRTNTANADFPYITQDQNGNNIDIGTYRYVTFFGLIAKSRSINFSLEQLKGLDAENLIILIQNYGKAIQISSDQFDTEDGTINITLPSDIELPCNFIFAGTGDLIEDAEWYYELGSNGTIFNTTAVFATKINNLFISVPYDSTHPEIEIINQNINTSGNPKSAAVIGGYSSQDKGIYSLFELSFIANDSSLQHQINGVLDGSFEQNIPIVIINQNI